MYQGMFFPTIVIKSKSKYIIYNNQSKRHFVYVCSFYLFIFNIYLIGRAYILLNSLGNTLMRMQKIRKGIFSHNI